MNVNGCQEVIFSDSAGGRQSFFGQNQPVGGNDEDIGLSALQLLQGLFGTEGVLANGKGLGRDYFQTVLESNVFYRRGL